MLGTASIFSDNLLRNVRTEIDFISQILLLGKTLTTLLSVYTINSEDMSNKIKRM